MAVEERAQARRALSVDALVVAFVAVNVLLGLTAVASNQRTPEALWTLAFVACVIAGIALAFMVTGRTHYAVLFLCAVTVRLALVVALEAHPPQGHTSGGRFPTMTAAATIFEDESFYLSRAQERPQRPWQVVRDDPYQRIAHYYGGVFSWANSTSTVWVRLANTVVGGLTAVLLYAGVIGALPRARRAAWWVVVACPVLVLWSALFLKEGLLLLGTALITHAIGVVHRRGLRSSTVMEVAAGVAVCVYVRSSVLTPFLGVALLTVFVLRSRRRRNAGFLPVLLVIGAAIAVLVFWTDLITTPGLERGGLAVALGQTDIAAGTKAVPLLSTVAELGGPLRILGFVALLALSPVITSVGTLLVHPSWATFAVACYALTWWTALPLVGMGIWRAVRTRDTWWLAWAGPFVLWCILVAISAGGGNYDAFRYREALFPMTLLLAAYGLYGAPLAARTRGRLRMYFGALAALLAVDVLAGLGLVDLVLTLVRR